MSASAASAASSAPARACATPARAHRAGKRARTGQQPAGTTQRAVVARACGDGAGPAKLHKVAVDFAARTPAYGSAAELAAFCEWEEMQAGALRTLATAAVELPDATLRTSMCGERQWQVLLHRAAALGGSLFDDPTPLPKSKAAHPGAKHGSFVAARSYASMRDVVVTPAVEWYAGRTDPVDAPAVVLASKKGWAAVRDEDHLIPLYQRAVDQADGNDHALVFFGPGGRLVCAPLVVGRMERPNPLSMMGVTQLLAVASMHADTTFDGQGGPVLYPSHSDHGWAHTLLIKLDDARAALQRWAERSDSELASSEELEDDTTYDTYRDWCLWEIGGQDKLAKAAAAAARLTHRVVHPKAYGRAMWAMSAASAAHGAVVRLRKRLTRHALAKVEQTGSEPSWVQAHFHVVREVLRPCMAKLHSDTLRHTKFPPDMVQGLRALSQMTAEERAKLQSDVECDFPDDGDNHWLVCFEPGGDLVVLPVPMGALFGLSSWFADGVGQLLAHAADLVAIRHASDAERHQAQRQHSLSPSSPDYAPTSPTYAPSTPTHVPTSPAHAPRAVPASPPSRSPPGRERSLTPPIPDDMDNYTVLCGPNVDCRWVVEPQQHVFAAKWCMWLRRAQ